MYSLKCPVEFSCKQTKLRGHLNSVFLEGFLMSNKHVFFSLSVKTPSRQRFSNNLNLALFRFTLAGLRSYCSMLLLVHCVASLHVSATNCESAKWCDTWHDRRNMYCRHAHVLFMSIKIQQPWGISGSELHMVPVSTRLCYNTVFLHQAQKHTFLQKKIRTHRSKWRRQANFVYSE